MLDFFFNKIEFLLDMICEVQSQTYFEEGFLHSIGPAVNHVENCPSSFKADLSKTDIQALTSNI